MKIIIILIFSISTIFAQECEGDVNNDDIVNILDLVHTVNIILDGNNECDEDYPPSDGPLTGIWQLNHVRFYKGDDCSSLELDEEHFGPLFIIDNYDVETEECNEFIEHDNFQAELWYVHNDNYTSFDYAVFDYADDMYSFNNDSDCNGNINSCGYGERNYLFKELEAFNYTMDADSLYLQEVLDLEIYNGLQILCYDSSEPVDCSIDSENCTTYIFDNCIDMHAPYDNDFDASSYELIDSNTLQTNEVVIDTYYSNGEYYMQQCLQWEYTYTRIDNLLIEGCMDESYSNYNPYANIDDGTCNNNGDCFDYLRGDDNQTRLHNNTLKRIFGLNN